MTGRNNCRQCGEIVDAGQSSPSASTGGTGHALRWKCSAHVRNHGAGTGWSRNTRPTQPHAPEMLQPAAPRFSGRHNSCASTTTAAASRKFVLQGTSSPCPSAPSSAKVIVKVPPSCLLGAPAVPDRYLDGHGIIDIETFPTPCVSPCAGIPSERPDNQDSACIFVLLVEVRPLAAARRPLYASLPSLASG